jgi:group I intron endonuclease
MKKAIIYTIINIKNNKVYVGSTIREFYERRNSHKNSLIKGTHVNSHLQRAFNKYGEDNFIFEILEECDIQYCRTQEQYWINMLNVTNRNFGYNILSIPGSRLNIKHTQESKDKMSKSNIGRKITEKTRQKMRIASKERLIKYADKYKNFGGRPSDESIIKIKEALSKKVYKYDLENNFIEEYNSVTEAVLLNNIKRNNLSNIADCCRGKRKTANGFKWKYKKC